MSFRMVNWAYEQDLPPSPKFLLVTIADRADYADAVDCSVCGRDRDYHYCLRGSISHVRWFYWNDFWNSGHFLRPSLVNIFLILKISEERKITMTNKSNLRDDEKLNTGEKIFGIFYHPHCIIHCLCSYFWALECLERSFQWMTLY